MKEQGGGGAGRDGWEEFRRDENWWRSGRSRPGAGERGRERGRGREEWCGEREGVAAAAGRVDRQSVGGQEPREMFRCLAPWMSRHETARLLTCLPVSRTAHLPVYSTEALVEYSHPGGTEVNDTR